jgi:c-di-GMP-binding flagellar brake protein YcgR
MHNKQPCGAERRTTKRYDLRGDVRIVPQGTDIVHCGHILDLSAGGCLIRLLDPSHHLRRGMLVEVGIQLNFVAFRAVATIRHVAEDRSDVGICFASIGRRARSDLLDLMVELEAAEAAEAAASALANAAH